MSVASLNAIDQHGGNGGCGADGQAPLPWPRVLSLLGTAALGLALGFLAAWVTTSAIFGVPLLTSVLALLVSLPVVLVWLFRREEHGRRAGLTTVPLCVSIMPLMLLAGAIGGPGVHGGDHSLDFDA